MENEKKEASLEEKMDEIKLRMARMKDEPIAQTLEDYKISLELISECRVLLDKYKAEFKLINEEMGVTDLKEF